MAGISDPGSNVGPPGLVGASKFTHPAAPKERHGRMDNAAILLNGR